MIIKSVLALIAVGVLGLIFVLLSKFQCGRRLLLKVTMLAFRS
jgi:hypothetical protein